MLTGVLIGAFRHPREQGFTLVEMLVVMLAGTIVMIALFTILDVTLSQTSHTFTRVDATQRIRPVLENLENELHSACVGTGVTPIQAGSTNTSLAFLSQYGSAPNPTPVWHVVSLSGTNLIDTQYSVTGTAPNWAQGSQVGQPTTLLSNVLSLTFQYFAYQEVSNGSGGYYTDGAGNPYMILEDGANAVPGTSYTPAPNPLPASSTTPLSSTNAQSTAEVSISLTAGASANSGEVGTQERTYTNPSTNDIPVTVNDAIVLRFTPAPNHAIGGTAFGPCQ